MAEEIKILRYRRPYIFICNKTGMAIAGFVSFTGMLREESYMVSVVVLVRHLAIFAVPHGFIPLSNHDEGDLRLEPHWHIIFLP